MSAAIDRIEASRQRLLLAMSPPPSEPANPTGRAPDWFNRLKATPTVSAVLESLSAWWVNHPLRPLTVVATEASEAVARPVARRHPLALVAAAAGVGAALAWARPWRWIFRSALFAGLAPQLASRVLASLPLESWLAMAGAGRARSEMSPKARPASTERDA